MYRICLVILVVLAVSFSAAAQCGGVYFKETNRQMLSNGFAYNYFEDFDGDGLKDLFGFSPTAEGNYQVYFYKRLSANSFDTTAKTSSVTGVAGVFGTFGDVNNDGKKDLIVSTGQFLTTYLNDGTGRFLPNAPGVSSGGETFWAAGDLNNDGRADVLSTRLNNGNSTLYLRFAQPDNSFGAATEIAPSVSLPYSGYILASSAGIIVEDLNGDGFNDIAFHSGNLRVLTNNGNGTFTQTAANNFNRPIGRLSTVDLNNDGKKDFVSGVFQPTLNVNIYKIRILANDGNNTFTASDIEVPQHYVTGNHAQRNSYSAGDFDGDGDTDIIFLGIKKYLLLKNQGNLTFTQEEFRAYLKVDSAEIFDADTKTDVLTLNRPFIGGHTRTTSPNAVYTTENSVIFRQNVCNPIGQTKTVDFDGDGNTDRAFWNPSTGVWRYYQDSTQGNQVYFNWGASSFGDVPVPNDYDGDGRTDYAVYRKPTGTWWIYRSSDNQAVAVKFGITEDKPVAADYDADGRADIAVYRPSEGLWFVLQSQSGQVAINRFGLAEDRPLPSDYDGDGKADLTVFRPSTGVWYRLNSSNNSYFIAPFGIGTDRPVPADYDGDGRTNIAVYRNGTWFVLREDASASIFFWGIANDIPYLGIDYSPAVYAYRRNNQVIYASGFSEAFFSTTYDTGSSFNETLVSDILPPE